MPYKANKHKNPVAGVYMLKSIIDGKIYIGESVDLVHRISQYRNMYRRKAYLISTPIDRAVLEQGFDSFSITILESSTDIPELKNTAYRRERESYFISLYDSTNPDIGYNRIRSNQTGLISDGKKHSGYPIEEHAKLIASKPLLAWTIADDSVTMYLGGRSYCDIHGYKDESMASASVKKGQPLHGDIMYRLDFGERMDDAIAIVKKQRKKILAFEAADKMRNADSARKWLIRYVTGLNRINEWCIEWGYDVVDISIVTKE